MWKPVNPENMSTCQHSAHLTHITSGPRRASLMKSSFLPVIFGVPYVGYAFVPPPASPLVGRVVAARQISGMSMSCNKGADNNRSNGNNNSGAIRSRIQGVAVALALSTSIALGAPSGPALAEELPAGTNPFTSICMGFGCGEFRGLEYPGAPAPTDEDSITFKSFLESLDKGLIAKVDFSAGGDKAYAYVKPSGGGGEPTRIRVGEGYPDEQGDGWSSPLWVVRALNDRKVPYHFEYDLGQLRATKTVAK